MHSSANYRPLRGSAQYAGWTRAVDTADKLYSGNYRLSVTWSASGGAINAAISGLSGITSGGNTVTQIGFQHNDVDVSTTAAFSGSDSTTVQYSKGSQGVAPPTGFSPTHTGVFLGNQGPDGPYAVVGSWSLTDTAATPTNTITVAFGTDRVRVPQFSPRMAELELPARWQGSESDGGSPLVLRFVRASKAIAGASGAISSRSGINRRSDRPDQASVRARCPTPPRDAIQPHRLDRNVSESKTHERGGLRSPSRTALVQSRFTDVRIGFLDLAPYLWIIQGAPSEILDEQLHPHSGSVIPSIPLFAEH